jgi:hypothetical protein
VCRISKRSARREQWSLQNMMTYHFWIQLNILQCTFIYFHTNLRMFSVVDYEVSLILIIHINGKLIFICNELLSSKTFFSFSNVLVHLKKWGNTNNFMSISDSLRMLLYNDLLVITCYFPFHSTLIFPLLSDVCRISHCQLDLSH